MNIKRQYSLPNCTLILEGLSDNLTRSDSQDNRPLLSILVNVECRFVGTSQTLQGGRTFLENLAKTVSAYAQEYLSSIPHPQDTQGNEDLIRLEKIEGTDLHLLKWQPSTQMSQSCVELELNTVQLFDLVESLDQFFADSRTLPDFSLQLHPISRRYRPPDEPLGQRAVPATLGIGSLALMALILFFFPIPEIREPELTPPETSTKTIPKNNF
ncbi:DUF4335 domain-containing protein [cyanobacterium endosymbiont of Epithemia clementina EcSB]|uniref:DUF4335 domain-containing protein n=1 Tax=cyanobacterium endosymbiont of Epithemia clementina EcSB TaxID=3034674 RepID=UPI002481886D|nr:DUF4335 domain-containing protein [cyanobacterium endosymbiont of Epithemia clementina EcSB]WGT67770.1 DUF4335 domain-containing protein [cyanobacterium endosymbiont of Epithemia clementina EcSB]